MGSPAYWFYSCLFLFCNISIQQPQKNAPHIYVRTNTLCHTFCTGALTGSLMNVIGSARSYLFAKIDTNKKPIALFYAFVLMYLVALFFTWKGLISILPVIGMISGTIAFWQTNPRHIRMIGLISPPLWFTYNFISGSYPGMLAEIVLLSSNLIGIYRFDFLPKIKKSIIKL